MLELRETHQSHEGKASSVPPTTEDIILVEDEQEPQYLWNLLRFTILYLGEMVIFVELFFMFHLVEGMSLTASTTVVVHL